VEIVSTEFLWALASIVIIDLVLAGDNAIVIALAARNVPRHLQKRAIIAGTAGAVIVRSSMTLIVVWLLQIPGLQFVGGLLLVFIACRLLRPEAEKREADPEQGAASFWGAMRTIVIADAIMGLDNVLGVAGAAHGSFLLVVMGLLISVPIVIWGSTLVLKLVERHPSIVYVGAAVLAWTAVNMMTSEPLLAEALADKEPTVPLLYVLVIFGVLWSGFVANHHRLESRISARATRLRGRRDERAGTLATIPSGEHAMMKILVPVDGSSNSMHAARHVVAELLRDPAVEIHLVSVQGRFSRHIAQFLNRKDLEQFYLEEAENKLLAVRRYFDQREIPYIAHVEIGHKAEIIAEMAKRLGCHHIVMGTARKNSLTRMFEASVTNRVLELTTVPVEVIAGDAISKLERYGIPAAIGAGLALLLAVDD
jgi:YjbE family integral membrane protein